MSEPLVNSHFDDFPIDYFQIKQEDIFDTRGFENGSDANANLQSLLELNPHHIINLNENGFIGEELDNMLDYSQKDTSVINCAVGQGKTTAILKSLKKKYDENPNLHFIIAVPYVSLIEQYERDLVNIGISTNNIFNYSKIGETSENGGRDYLQLNRRVHIVTANTLLGNPGENALMQSEVKHQYLTGLKELLENNNKKVVLIFDEIHDTIHNFSSIGIIHLFKWENIINKIIVLSATYNVASIAVIRFFTKLTDDRFQIFESKREVIKPQSKLFLHYDNGIYNSNNYTIKNLVTSLLEQEKNIDIISYSRNLSKELLDIEGEIGAKLTERFGMLKDCTSEINNNQPDSDELPANRFDNSSCNIGTNFKTGVSINKENHALIVILPPANARRTYGSYNGIFADGVNSVIQTLARQRTNGEIHIVLPSPIELDTDTLENMDSEQLIAFKEAYEKVCIPSISIETRNNVSFPINKYIPFNKHISIIREKYERIVGRNLIAVISASQKGINLPSIEEFILENASKALIEEGFLGKDLSSFVTYCAFTNQFYNAKLHQIISSPSYQMDNIDEVIRSTYSEYLLADGGFINHHQSISQKYQFLVNKLIENTNLRLSSSNKSKIRLKIFNFLTNQSSHTDINSSFVYLLEEYNNLENSTDEEKQALVLQLREFIRKVNDSVINENGVSYFKKYSENKIFENDKSQIFQLVNLLKEKNNALKLSGAKFFRESTEDTIERDFYNYLHY